MKQHNSMDPGIGNVYVYFEEAAEAFEAMNAEEQDARYAEVLEILKRRSKDSPGDVPLLSGIQTVECKRKAFKSLKSSISQSADLVWRVMVLPACVTIVFAILLCLSDLLDSWKFLAPAAIVAVLISSYALWWLVRWAVRSFNV